MESGSVHPEKTGKIAEIITMREAKENSLLSDLFMPNVMI
jgi:hypothetical protein